MNNIDITHYIITRFNMPWDRGEGDAKRGLDPVYLENRFELFDRYTVPSMKYQTCKNFKWLVIYDKRTPKEYLKKINEYKELGFYEPIFVEPGFSLSAFVETLKKDKNECFITSRVDNDDALMPDYVETVQRKARDVFPKDKYLTSIRNYRYDAKDKTLTSYRLKKNHFISKTGNVYEVGQNNMPSDPHKYARIPGVHSLEIVHESNLLNSTIYTFHGMVSNKEYENIKKILDLELLAQSCHKKFCIDCAKRDFSKSVLRNKEVLMRIIKKHILKGLK